MTYTYDDLGNLLTATRGGAVVTLTYDQAGRKLTMADPDMGGWNYTYDALGNMTRQKDAKDQVTCLYYDELNRLRGKDYFTNSANCPSDPGINNYDVSYEYDAGTYGKGRRTSTGNADSLTVWTYDSRGRVVAEAKKVDGILYPSTSFTYNSADLPVTMTYPYGETVTTKYTDRMLVDKLVNENGTPNNPADDYYYINSTIYDSASRMTSRSLGNGLTQEYDYYTWDQQGGHLQNITTGPLGSLQNLTYTYDAVGNILSIASSAGGSQTQNFEYDDLDRLWHASATGTAAEGGYAQETYDYSTSTGNLQLKGDFALHYEDASHAHAVTSATMAGVTNTYTYDANGNMETRVANGQSHKYHYDAENRLVKVTNLAGDIQYASFEYDADGARIQSVMDGETIIFIGSHCEITDPGTNQIVTRYYLAGAARVAMRKGETLSYLLADHIGSTSLTTDANGVRTSELRYKAFGETRFSYGTMPTKYTFTGQYAYNDDPSTPGVTEGFGLIYFNARWMDPSLGRFAQPDTIVPTQTQGTQAWDRYAFVNNNPVRYNDPTGHCIGPLAGAVCGVVAGLVMVAIKDAVTPGLDLTVTDYMAGAFVGAAAGALIGTGVGAGVGVAMAAAYLGAGTGMASAAIAYTAMSGDEYNSAEMAANAGIGAATGLASSLTGPAVVGAKAASSIAAHVTRAGISALGAQTQIIVGDSFFDSHHPTTGADDLSGAATVGTFAYLVGQGISLAVNPVFGQSITNLIQTGVVEYTTNDGVDWVDCVDEYSCGDDE